MPNTSKRISRNLTALIAEIEAEAYARGRADARNELLDVLAGNSGQSPRTGASRGRQPKKTTPGKPRARGRKRAPRGSVPRFVERALRDRPGSTVQEIMQGAATEVQRSIKLPSIRRELHIGRKEGKYVSIGRRWSLAASEPKATGTGKTASSDSSPASEPDRGERQGALGLNW